MRLASRTHGPVGHREINLGVVVAVLVASLAAGFIGGLIVWVLWRYDLLQLGDRRGQP